MSSYLQHVMYQDLQLRCYSTFPPLQAYFFAYSLTEMGHSRIRITLCITYIVNTLDMQCKPLIIQFQCFRESYSLSRYCWCDN